jgi:hypothetical protein
MDNEVDEAGNKYKITKKSLEEIWKELGIVKESTKGKAEKKWVASPAVLVS